jgi:hypothetical protein
MISATHKFNRSGFTRTISVINLTGRMQLVAPFDFWRPVALVFAMGILTKCVQALLTN